MTAEGEMLNVMYQIGGFHTLQDMIRESERRGGLNQNALDKITEVIKSCQVKNYLGHSEKVWRLGPPANHPDSATRLNVTINCYHPVADNKDSLLSLSLLFIQPPPINTEYTILITDIRLHPCPRCCSS